MTKKKWLLLVLSAVLASILYVVVVRYNWSKAPVLEVKEQTSISPAVHSDKAFQAAFQREYSGLSKALTGSYIIPGLVEARSIHAKGAKKGRIGVATDMDPQGTTIAGDYLVISGYSKKKDFHSVLWLIDKRTGQYIKTVVLADTSHVGGIAYDEANERLWITIFDEKLGAGVASVTYQDLLDYDVTSAQKGIAYEKKHDLGDVKLASYMAIYDGSLYVGYFDDDKAGILGRYPMDTAGNLAVHGDEQRVDPVKTYPTFPEIQGLTITDEKVYMSASYGDKDSKLYVYANPGVEEWTSFEKDKHEKVVTFPPYMEQIYADRGTLYVNSEGATTRYRRNHFILNMDRVIALDVNKLPED